MKTLCSVVLMVFVAASASSAAAEDVVTYDVGGYRALEREMEEADLARLATEPGSDARSAATLLAIQRRRQLIQYISGWLSDGSLNEAQAAQARDARLVLVENLVRLNVEIGRCDDAESAVASLAGFQTSADSARQAAYDDAVRAVAECRGAPATERLTLRSPQRPAGLALIGVGAASVGAALVWNAALLDDAAALDRARGRCEDPATTTDEVCSNAQELRGRVHGAKAPIVALASAGGVVAAVGGLLLATGHDTAADVVARVRVGDGWVGAELSGLARRRAR
ncbi:MAG: hypothetical protein H6700_10335 [Myxococcales bacterium]|nr:hypothetical protein [Myxococcales bacterium]